MFYQIFLAMFLALACPKHAHKSPATGTTVTTQDDAPSNGGDDSGGEEGHVPPSAN